MWIWRRCSVGYISGERTDTDILSFHSIWQRDREWQKGKTPQALSEGNNHLYRVRSQINAVIRWTKRWMIRGRDLNVALVKGQQVEALPDLHKPAVITPAENICSGPVDEMLETWGQGRS